MIRRLLCLTLLLPCAAVAQGIPPEQLPPGAGFTWEHVGDRGLNPAILAVGSDGALWAGGSAGFVYLADPSAPGAAWEEREMFTAVSEGLLPLGRGPQGDTLLGSGGGGIRSLDGGRTWEGIGYAYKGFAHGPASRLLKTTGGAAYSDDRGATWTEAVHPGDEGSYTVLALPPAPARPAWRVLSGGWDGVAVSADSGRSYAASGLWQAYRYIVEAMGAVATPGGPAGARTVIAAGREEGAGGLRAWTSADDGATWSGPALLPDVADGGVSFQAVRALVPLGGSAAVAVLGRGAIYRTDDAGATWTVVGRAPMEGATPEEVQQTLVRSAALGRDGRLYVALLRIGCCYRAWVWRTAEPVAVAAEAGPEAPGAGLSLAAVPNPSAGAVALALTLGAPEASVRVSLYDGLGREVAVVHEGALAAGPHRLSVAAGRLSPGVYVARAVGGAGAASARLVVTR